MSDSTTQLAQVNFADYDKETTVNELFDAHSPASLFGRNADTTSALTWGYYGGKYRKADGTIVEVVSGTVSLTASATNYILETDGVVSKVTVAPSGWPSPLAGGAKALYQVVCDGSGVNPAAWPTGGYKDYRTTGIGSGNASTPDAADVSIADVGTYYTGTDVEAALQEIGATLATLSGTSDVDTDEVFTSDTGSTADSDPGAGLFKWDNATQASATALYMDNQTADAVSLVTFFASLPPDGYIHLAQNDDATKWQVWKWSGLPTAATGYYKFTGLTLMASGGSIANTKAVSVSFKGTTPSTWPFDVQTFYPGIPTASAKIYRGKLARAVTFAANFSGSQFTATANATASTVFDIQKNGSSVGSCTIAAGGTTPTFATSGGTSVSFAAGDVLAIIAPGTADLTLTDPAITLAGTR
jgi:hypothetical protein